MVIGNVAKRRIDEEVDYIRRLNGNASWSCGAYSPSLIISTQTSTKIRFLSPPCKKSLRASELIAKLEDL
jgi:hypothetical protein